MDFLLGFVIGFLVISVILCIYIGIKNQITNCNYKLIGNAIYEYRLDMILSKKDYEVDWGDMESYDTTLWRLWDWGYTRILPPDKFEIIKPYIQKEKK